MKNLKEDLNKVVYDVIYENDIKDIILILREQCDLKEYISNLIPVDFNYDEFHGESHENAVDYDQFRKCLVINMPVLVSKTLLISDYEDYIYNWMTLFYEIYYALEDIKLLKYEENHVKNNVTTVVNTYKDFIRESSLAEYYPVLLKLKRDKLAKGTEVVNPIERLKMIHAYFNTLDIFSNLSVDPKHMERFKALFEDELLKGYDVNNQNVYPLRNIFFQSSYLDGRIYMSKFRWYKDEPMVAISGATKEVHSIKERLALGYPIDSVDYNMVRRHKI